MLKLMDIGHRDKAAGVVLFNLSKTLRKIKQRNKPTEKEGWLKFTVYDCLRARKWCLFLTVVTKTQLTLQYVQEQENCYFLRLKHMKLLFLQAKMAKHWQFHMVQLNWKISDADESEPHSGFHYLVTRRTILSVFITCSKRIIHTYP